jgi:hypothetical protein
VSKISNLIEIKIKPTNKPYLKGHQLKKIKYSSKVFEWQGKFTTERREKDFGLALLGN